MKDRTDELYPSKPEVALSDRKHRLEHPWYRGYPNNKRLRKIRDRLKPDRKESDAH